MSDIKDTEKIIVRLKDITSICWLASQGIKVVCDVPTIVAHTSEVRNKIKAGVLEVLDNQKYELYHKKKAKTEEEKLDLAIEVFNNFLNEKDISSAEKQLENIKKLGLKGRSLNSLTGKLTYAKRQVEAEILKEERRKIAVELVDTCMTEKVFSKNKDKVFCLGEIKVGKNADEIVKWASKNDENIDTLKEALENTDKETIAMNLVSQCIEKEVIVKGENDQFMLDSLRLGKEAEEVVEWALLNDENIEKLQIALTEKLKGDNPS